MNVTPRRGTFRCESTVYIMLCIETFNILTWHALPVIKLLQVIFIWDLRADRRVSWPLPLVYARFFQFDSPFIVHSKYVDRNVWMCVRAVWMCGWGNYDGVYCDWCSLLESYNLFNYVQSYSSKAATKCIFQAQNGRIQCVFCLHAYWVCRGIAHERK